MTPTATRAKIMPFILLTMALSSPFYFMMWTTGSTRDIVALWMWSPGLAALAAQWFFTRSLRVMGWQLGPRKYLLSGFGIPLIYASVVYLSAWAADLAGFRQPSPIC